MKKPKYKMGDRMKIIEDDCGNFEPGDVAEITHIDNDRDGLIYELTNDRNAGNLCEDELEPLVKTLDNLEVGDVLVKEGCGEMTVLGVCGKAVFTSGRNTPDYYGEAWSIEELKRSNWTLKQPEEDVTEEALEKAKEMLKKEGYRITKKESK